MQILKYLFYKNAVKKCNTFSLKIPQKQTFFYTSWENFFENEKNRLVFCLISFTWGFVESFTIFWS